MDSCTSPQTCGGGGTANVCGGGTTSNLDAQATKAYTWMVSTLTSGGFYNSQTDDTVCYTYDQAVTVVAFLIKGDTTRAHSLLREAAIQAADRRFLVHGVRPQRRRERRQSEVAWADDVGRHRRRELPKYTGSTEFDAMAKKNLDYALKTQASNGALEIGQGQGTEENSDAYAALTAFGYTTQAAKVATFINSHVEQLPESLQRRSGRHDPLPRRANLVESSPGRRLVRPTLPRRWTT